MGGKVIAMPPPPAAHESGFSIGQRVQLRQHEVLPTDPQLVRADPPIPGGPTEFWIYGKIARIADDGTISVEVNHPANRQHGATVLVKPPYSELRTKADVMAQHDALVEPNQMYLARKKAHLKTQADNLD
jgi:hypothetical protein